MCQAYLNAGPSCGGLGLGLLLALCQNIPIAIMRSLMKFLTRHNIAVYTSHTFYLPLLRRLESPPNPKRVVGIPQVFPTNMKRPVRIASSFIGFLPKLNYAMGIHINPCLNKKSNIPIVYGYHIRSVRYSYQKTLQTRPKSDLNYQRWDVSG